MLRAVLDTNIIVSAALSSHGTSAKIINFVFDKKLQIFFSTEMMGEYEEVLSRSRLKLSHGQKDMFLKGIKKLGILIRPVKSNILLPDESDRTFYDTAKEADAILVTNNLKHYPHEVFILSPVDFWTLYGID
jgi:putative PIN family toxin of toxin-antitoxin system